MADSEEKASWLRTTNQELALARTGDILTPHHDQQLWQQAHATEFAERYQQTLLPEHETVWRTALGLLAVHGIPLRHSRDGRVHEPGSLSTGLLAVGEPVDARGEMLVPAIQLSSIDHRPGRMMRRRRTANRLGSMINQGIAVETGIAATSPQALNSESVEHREVRFGNRLDRLTDFTSSGWAVVDLLNASPDLACWFQVVPLQSTPNQPFILRRPITPVPSGSSAPDAHNQSNQIDQELALASDALAPVRELGDILRFVTEPLRSLPEFHRALQKQPE